MKKLPLSWIGIATGLLCLYLVFKGVSMEALKIHLSGFRPIFLLPAMLCIVFEFSVKALRWKTILSTPRYRPPFRNVFPPLVLGYFFDMILPARAGMLVRTVVLDRREPGSAISSILATVVAEKIFDACFILLLLLFCLWMYPVADAVKIAGLIMFAFVSMAVVLAMALRSKPRIFVRLIPGFLRAREKVEGLIMRISEGLDVLSNIRKTLGVAVLTLVNWSITFATCWILMKGYGFSVPFYAPALVMVFIAFSSALPAMPGLLGNYQLATVWALQGMGIPKEAALGFSLLYHAFGLAATALLALPHLPQEDFGVQKLLSLREEISRRKSKEIGG